MMQPPKAPHFITSCICPVPAWIPPIAYTGIVTALQTSFRKSVPLGGSPFLQLLEGKELQISSIEVDLPDEEDDTTNPAQENESSEVDQAVDSEHEKE